MTEGWESFATVDPFDGMTATNPGVVLNLVGGEWVSVADVRDDIVDPLNGAAFLTVPDTKDVATCTPSAPMGQI